MRPSDDIGGEPRKAERLQQNAHEWDKGKAGERMVAAALDALPHDYRVYHHVGLPGTKEALDHVVVGPCGVVAINDTYVDGDLQHGSGTLWRGKVPIRRETENVRWEADVLSTALQQPVDAVLCCAEATLPEPVVTLDRTAVVSLDALTGHIITKPAKFDADAIAVVA
ncbi:MAG TPA: nuclease-related domain-containing protein, partial [Ilumatobacteraceae bacterium]|nr:nuclease-related domain-containing protein [Ilumatobacteraceae bacterium]